MASDSYSRGSAASAMQEASPAVVEDLVAEEADSVRAYIQNHISSTGEFLCVEPNDVDQVMQSQATEAPTWSMQATILSKSNQKFILFAETEDNSDSCGRQLFQLQTISCPRRMWTTWLGHAAQMILPVSQNHFFAQKVDGNIEDTDVEAIFPLEDRKVGEFLRGLGGAAQSDENIGRKATARLPGHCEVPPYPVCNQTFLFQTYCTSEKKHTLRVYYMCCTEIAQSCHTMPVWVTCKQCRNAFENCR